MIMACEQMLDNTYIVADNIILFIGREKMLVRFVEKTTIMMSAYLFTVILVLAYKTIGLFCYDFFSFVYITLN